MAKKENTSAAAKVAKAEKQAAKGAEDSKLTSAQKVAKAEKSKAKAAKPKNPNGNIFQRLSRASRSSGRTSEARSKDHMARRENSSQEHRRRARFGRCCRRSYLCHRPGSVFPRIQAY